MSDRKTPEELHQLFSTMFHDYRNFDRSTFERWISQEEAQEIVNLHRDDMVYEIMLRISGELRQLVADTLKPEQIGGKFIHPEVTLFAKQLQEFIERRINELEAEIER